MIAVSVRVWMIAVSVRVWVVAIGVRVGMIAVGPVHARRGNAIADPRMATSVGSTRPSRGVTPEASSLSDGKGIALAGTAMRPNNANTDAVNTFRMWIPPRSDAQPYAG